MSSGSESDDEYVPVAPEQLSEEDSADDETENQYEKEQEYKAKKRKAAEEINGTKKCRTLRNSKAETTDTKPEIAEEVQLDPVEEKKREEDLWAQFLDGTDTKPKAQEKKNITKETEPSKDETKWEKEKPKEKQDNGNNESAAERERKIFEFAGETIVVENNVIKEKIKTADVTATASKPIIPARGKGAGLSNLVGQLNKKNKLSTLEKSKLDWDTFKQDEGIEEEIKTHNKGKAGYLERQDFLERADVRQYEIERDLRLNKRSKR